MFQDSFYTLLETTTDAEGNYNCRVRFNASHFIYEVHFQGNPITPGACLIQIIKELTELITGKKLFINEIKNLKFLNINNPNEQPEVIFQLSLSLNEEENAYLSKVIIFSGETVFAKISLTQSIIQA